MEKFCEYCGKKLEEGEVCNCQAEKKEDSGYKSNTMVGKSYSFTSSPFMCISIARGRIFTDIVADAEKMNVETDPKRKNKIPTLYFKDIKEVNVSVKISAYSLLIAILLFIVGFVSAGVGFLLGALWVWIAVNRRIRITLTNGNFVDIYSNAKKPAEDFANELRKVLN